MTPAGPSQITGFAGSGAIVRRMPPSDECPEIVVRQSGQFIGRDFQHSVRGMCTIPIVRGHFSASR